MIKRGVRLHGVCPQMFWAATVVKDLWKSNDYPFCITSGIEGTHSVTSDHWAGRALDFRTWRDMTGVQMDSTLKRSLRIELERLLGDEYFVLMEGNHLHISYRPLKAL